MNIEQMSERLQKILMDAINLAKSNQHPSGYSGYVGDDF